MTPLRGRASFVNLRRNGVRTRSGALNISFAPGDDGGPVQVGYAISRRVGSAVERNRLRRRLRSALTEMARAGDPTLRGGSYVLSPTAAAAQLSYQDLAAALRGVFNKATQRAEKVCR